MKTFLRCLLFFVAICLPANTCLAVGPRIKIDGAYISSSLNSNYLTEIELKVNKLNGTSLPVYEPKYIHDAKLEGLTKKTIYLLLGPIDKKSGYLDYVNRKNDLLDIAYKTKNIYQGSDNYTYQNANGETSTSKLDFSQMNEPSLTASLMPEFSNLNISYDSYGIISVDYISQKKDFANTSSTIENIQYDRPDSLSPDKIVRVEADLTLRLSFEKQADVWKVRSVSHKINDRKRFDDQPVGNIASIKSDTMENDYDLSKLKAISNDKINHILNDNLSNVLAIDTIYDKSIIDTGTGFFVAPGLIATSWGYINNSLRRGQFIQINGADGSYYELDGVALVDFEADIAILKLKERVNRAVKMAPSLFIARLSPLFIIHPDSIGNIIIDGAVAISSEGITNKNSLPSNSINSGAPIFNENGLVVGINHYSSSKQASSTGTNSYRLSDLVNKLASRGFENNKSISYSDLKEQYYYKTGADVKVINTVPKSVWEKYGKIGNLKDNIKLKLTKASFEKGVVSLRYSNPLSAIISGKDSIIVFLSQLKRDGYKKVYESNTKLSYVKDGQRVVIMFDFNMVIVLIAKE